MKTQKHMALIALASTSLLFLSGCVSHLTQQQCKAINWYQMGFSDGQTGQNPRSLQRDIVDCAKFKLKVNAAAYQHGWKAGVKAYCKPGNAYKLGVQGKNYNHICPTNMKKAFTQSWRRGLRKFCTPSTGYRLGRSGDSMPNFCALDQVNQFRNAYESGHRIYKTIAGTQAELNNANLQISNVNNQIAILQNEIRDQENRARLDRDTRHDAYRIIRIDRHKIRDLKDQLSGLTNRRDTLQLQLNQEKMHP